MSTAPYISRPVAEDLLKAFADALLQPKTSPVVFNLSGIGGVGKSTLVKKLVEGHPNAAIPLVGGNPISFGQTEGIDEPIGLMKRLHEMLEASLPQKPILRREPDRFAERYTQFFDVVHQLQSSAPGGQPATPEQVTLVKQWVSQATKAVGLGATALGHPQVGGAVTVMSRGVNTAVDMAATVLSEKDRLQQLLQQHEATRNKRELQALINEPVRLLTEAFVERLAYWAKQKAIILILDTYEKVPPAVDSWLWRSLIGNTDVALQRVRLVVAGRRDLVQTEEGWRKLQQDRNCVFSRAIDRFDEAQTYDYLRRAGVDEAEHEAIFRATRGLPYYLNWVRQELALGRTLNFAAGNEEIQRLLLQGLEAAQTLMVQMAACCLSFDKALIRHLAQDKGLEEAAQEDWFDWLRQRSFVERAQEGDQRQYRLDDVARDVFRRALYDEDEAAFRQVNETLADYFYERSNREVSPDRPPPEIYGNSDWRRLRSAFLYYLLFTRREDVEVQVVTHLFEGRYLRQEDVLQQAVAALAGRELDLACHATQQFLEKIALAILLSWPLLEETSLDYGWLKDNMNLCKASVDQTLAACFKPLNRLAGLAKFAGLIYRSKRCPSAQQLSYLHQAQQYAEQVARDDDPDFSSRLYWWSIGVAFSDLGHHKAAVTAYDSALSIKPDLHEALNNKGVALGRLGHYRAAIVAFDDALAIKSDLQGVLNNRGLALAYLGEYKAAITSYSAALAIQPDLCEALHNKGNALESLGEYEAAVATYNAALAIKPDIHEVLYNKGILLSRLGQYKAAIDSYNAALAIKPDDHEALYEKGVLLSYLGRYEAAILTFDAALAVQPENYEALYSRGLALGYLGQYEAAITACDIILGIKPNKHEAFYNKGYALSCLGRYKSALSAYDAFLAIEPNSGIAVYRKASCFGLQHKVDKAVTWLKKAIALDEKYRAIAADDTDFDAIRGDERFQQIIAPPL